MNVEVKKASIDARIEAACHRVNRDVNEIKVIAVTKYVSSSRTEEAVQAGIDHLGENRIEGLLAKQAALADYHNVTWHFIGTLQSRKVKDVVGVVDYIHSLDRLSVAKEIDKRSEQPVACFLQVNVSGEDAKQGLHPEEVFSFMEKLQAFPKVQIVGLMTMAPFTEEEEVIRSCFKSLREIRDAIKEKEYPFAPCTYLSMGMSNDFEIAIEEGATHIRIGTSLVGEEE